jgi:hypothetical protein
MYLLLVTRNVLVDLDSGLFWGERTVFLTSNIYVTMNMDPRQHGMARPQVADGGTASDMEGSCE